jgi:hypothetical protein
MFILSEVNRTKRNPAFQFTAAVILLTGRGIGPVLAGEESPAVTSAKATITQEHATEIALARVPGGSIIEAELEKEHGKLVWSFDISQPDSMNISEVQVDAKTGEIVAEETETPGDEANEDSKHRR